MSNTTKQTATVKGTALTPYQKIVHAIEDKGGYRTNIAKMGTVTTLEMWDCRGNVLIIQTWANGGYSMYVSTGNMAIRDDIAMIEAL